MTFPISLMISCLIVLCFTWALQRWSTFHIDLMKLGVSTLIPIFYTNPITNALLVILSLLIVIIFCTGSITLQRAHDFRLSKNSKLEISFKEFMLILVPYFSSIALALLVFIGTITVSLKYASIFANEDINEVNFNVLWSRVHENYSHDGVVVIVVLIFVQLIIRVISLIKNANR